MPLINGEINLTSTWSVNCVISNSAANQGTTLLFKVRFYKLIIL